VSPPTDSDFTEKWAAYRKVRRSMFIAWLAPFPAVLGAIFFQDRIHGGTYIALAVAVGWLGTFWYWNQRWLSWPCPRCGAPFVSISRPWLRACPSCGLPIFASTGARATA
jgi:hypothetical protein